MQTIIKFIRSRLIELCEKNNLNANHKSRIAVFLLANCAVSLILGGVIFHTLFKFASPPIVVMLMPITMFFVVLLSIYIAILFIMAIEISLRKIVKNSRFIILIFTAINLFGSDPFPKNTLSLTEYEPDELWAELFIINETQGPALPGSNLRIYAYKNSLRVEYVGATNKFLYVRETPGKEVLYYPKNDVFIEGASLISLIPGDASELLKMDILDGNIDIKKSADKLLLKYPKSKISFFKSDSLTSEEYKLPYDLKGLVHFRLN